MKSRKGFVLVAVFLALLFLLAIVPVMVNWVQQDTKFSVKDQKSGAAFGLAEAAVDRGFWKIKSSTSTFAQVTAGGVLPGYNFDATYSDISGGTYRIRISSGPELDQVTVYGEGRNSLNDEVRAIKAVFTNTSVPGAILSAGALSASEASVVHWGPIMSKGNITVSGDGALNNGYPRKLSMGTVLPAANFDSTGDTNPPNTDSLEWWSNYNVPDLPIFDFEAMRSSAAQNGVLNCQDASSPYKCAGSGCTDPGGSCACVNKWQGATCVDPGGNCSCAGAGAAKVCSGFGCHGPASATCVNIVPNVCTGNGCLDDGANCDCTAMVCCHSATYGGPVTCDYGAAGEQGCTDCTVTSLFLKTDKRDMDYTWYWRRNAILTGYNGIKGTVVVRGNLSVPDDMDDRYCKSTVSSNDSNCVVPVPNNAWREYQKYDTAAVDEYPGDTGLHQNAATYQLGDNESSAHGGVPDRYTSGELWRMPYHTSGLGADLGFYGFLYVEGNFTRDGASDIYGSMWVNGVVTGSGNTMVFYNSKLKVPTLNVVLSKESWQENPPSAAAWSTATWVAP